MDLWKSYAVIISACFSGLSNLNPDLPSFQNLWFSLLVDSFIVDIPKEFEMFKPSIGCDRLNTSPEITFFS